ASTTCAGGPTSGLPRPRSTSGSPSRAAASATRASSPVKYWSGSLSSRLGRGARGAAELDGEPEGDVLIRRPMFADLAHAARAEPVADAAHELLGRGRAGCHADDRRVAQPMIVDLGGVVDEVGGHVDDASEIDDHWLRDA